MALSYRRIEGSPHFKDSFDSEHFELGDGPEYVQEWIRIFNGISQDVSGKPAVITSWYREDHTAHKGGGAVDFRRLSAANKTFPKYTQEDVEEIERRAARAGLPIYVIAEGRTIEHWHVGRITRAA